MSILAINSTTGHFGVSLLERDGSVRGEITLTQPKGHFGSLMPAIKFMMDSCGASTNSLEAVAAAVGPGSFTGLRIGLSAAKGFCDALGIPILGISSLEALALQAFCGDMPVVALIDSRRGEFFAASFGPDERGDLKRLSPDMCIKEDGLRDLFIEKAVAIGNNFDGMWPVIKEKAGERALPAPSRLWHTGAACVGTLALGRLERKEADDPDSLIPVYLRPPDIRPNPFPLKDPLPEYHPGTPG